jgi:phospholipase/carboxylesterase
MTQLKTIEIETAPHPGAAIIVLHGLGADGNDFVPICNEIDLSAIGPVRYVFPSAPEMPVTINGGYVMRAWYDILGTQIDRHEDETGLRASAERVSALIEREIARGIPAHRIVLMGFSQGCAMTLLTGLRYPERLAGLVALSGYLPLATATAAEKSDANTLTPIFMGHGRSDGVVPMARAQVAQAALQQLGYDIEWHDYPMAHSVCAEEVADLNRWLLRVLG